MKLRAGVLMTLLAALSMAAWAGDIEGKVTGMKGKSVVYVDAIAGRTFPAPKDHPVMDQKGLMFSPHILTIQQGTTVEFQNSDTVQHNAFWTAISGDKKAGHNLGTWPKGEKRPFTFAKAGVVPVLWRWWVIGMWTGPAGGRSVGVGAAGLCGGVSGVWAVRRS